MLRDWRNCDSIALNMHIMTNKANVSHRCSMLIIGVYSIAVVVYSSVIIELNNININAETGEKEHQLLLKMKFPFVHEFSPIYEIVMFFQFIQLLSNASVIGMLDALIITLVSFFKLSYKCFLFRFTLTLFSSVNTIILIFFLWIYLKIDVKNQDLH